MSVKIECNKCGVDIYVIGGIKSDGLCSRCVEIQTHKRNIQIRIKKYKMMLDIFEFLVKYEAGTILNGVYYESRMKCFELRRDKFLELVGNEQKFKNDGSLEEDLEKRIWIILNRLRIDYGG